MRLILSLQISALSCTTWTSCQLESLWKGLRYSKSETETACCFKVSVSLLSWSAFIVNWIMKMQLTCCSESNICHHTKQKKLGSGASIPWNPLPSSLFCFNLFGQIQAMWKQNFVLQDFLLRSLVVLLKLFYLNLTELNAKSWCCLLAGLPLLSWTVNTRWENWAFDCLSQRFHLTGHCLHLLNLQMKTRV